VREGGVEREEGCERRGERGRGSGREKGREGRVEGEEREGGGGVNGHIYSADCRIPYSCFGTRISVERRVKFRYSSEICNNGGKISGFTRDRDPSFTRAPMLTGAPNKGRGRSA